MIFVEGLFEKNLVLIVCFKLFCLGSIQYFLEASIGTDKFLVVTRLEGGKLERSLLCSLVKFGCLFLVVVLRQISGSDKIGSWCFGEIKSR